MMYVRRASGPDGLEMPQDKRETDSLDSELRTPGTVYKAVA